ncbi:potassium transporter [Sporanaerobium hydrogeniformans]|uniref:Potassium transporter n=1 Tax=Sporanaerobium hydrogeniformans TaxID=3072179 RepID=A0AC61DDC2_9FIRM|nr:cation:proton antiporter [Sporanaerobium hydrogeniformans]PHV70940.1 potassium transporter [Sporanaerobium hydrogeniformans]
MLTSLALIFLLGLILGSIFSKLKLPSLLGMLFTGILLGPYVLNRLDTSILSISADLRQLALVIILTRAGLALNTHDLKKVGRPAILMCFIPAVFEIIGILLLAPPLLGISLLDAAIMGTVVAAVSPAVIVPRMLKLMEEGYGAKNSIPQLIMAGASVDDIFVIVLFTSFTALAAGGSFTLATILQIPISIILGIVVGILSGLGLVILFKNFHMRDSAKTLILLSIAFLLIALEKALKGTIPLSGLLAVMSMGATLFQKYTPLAKRLSSKFSKLWVGAEILLFVLVGATVDLKYAASAGIIALFIILGALLFRMLGVFLCLLKTNLSLKERIFCMIAYCPKATVQAAIGSIPLAMGLGCGQIVLTVAVLSILITAPLGALGIDISYKHFLEH